MSLLLLAHGGATIPDPPVSGLLFSADWPTPGQATEAVLASDGAFDTVYGWPTNAQATLNVIANASAPAAFTYTTNVLRITQRGPTMNGTPYKANAFPLNQTLFMEWFVLNSGDTSYHLHPVTQNLIGGFQSIPFGLNAESSTTWRPFIRQLWNAAGTDIGSPYYQWTIGERSVGFRTLPQNTWYRYRCEIRIGTPGAVTTFRYYPELRTYNNADPTHIGTVLFDSSSYFDQNFTGQATGYSLDDYYAGGGYFGMPAPASARNFAFGQEGQGGSTDTGESWYVGRVRVWSDAYGS